MSVVVPTITAEHKGKANRKKQIRQEIVAVKRELRVSAEVIKGKSVGRRRTH